VTGWTAFPEMFKSAKNSPKMSPSKKMKKSDFITAYNREKAIRLFFLQLITLCAMLATLAAVACHQLTH